MVRRRGAVRSFPRHERLRHAGDIQAVFQRGKREEQPGFIALWRVGTQGRRVGFAVSRQLRSAVSRNRARRRLREAYRHHRSALPVDIEVMFVARPAVLGRAFRDLLTDMERAIASMTRASGRSA